MRDSAPLGDHDVVERPCARRSCVRRGRDPARSISRSSMAARPASARFERRVQLGQRDLGEEPEAAEVDAEDRQVAPGLARCGPPSASSVPSPPRTSTRSTRSGRSSRWKPCGARFRAVPAAAVSVFEDRFDAARRQPGRQFHQVRRRSRPAVPSRTMPDTFGPIGAASSLRDRYCGALRCSRNSWLPLAPVIGDGVMATRAKPTSARRGRDALDAPAACTSGSRTMPPLPTSPRPASNCGFTSATTSAPRRQQRRARAGGSGRSEMNETSMMTRSTRCPGRSVGRRGSAR